MKEGRFYFDYLIPLLITLLHLNRVSGLKQPLYFFVPSLRRPRSSEFIFILQYCFTSVAEVGHVFTRLAWNTALPGLITCHSGLIPQFPYPVALYVPLHHRPRLLSGFLLQLYVYLLTLLKGKVNTHIHPRSTTS